MKYQYAISAGPGTWLEGGEVNKVGEQWMCIPDSEMFPNAKEESFGWKLMFCYFRKQQIIAGPEQDPWEQMQG